MPISSKHHTSYNTREKEIFYPVITRNSIYLESIFSTSSSAVRSAFSIDASSVLSGYRNHEISLSSRKAIAKLKSFLALEKNRDSYGAEPVRSETVEKAKIFIEQADKEGIEIFFTAPGRDGEVLIELHAENMEAEIYFHPDESTKVLIFQNDDLVSEGNLDNLFDKLISNFGNYESDQ